MSNIFSNSDFYDVVGLIPASDKTPDIYYCGDPSSEKVAALTFLTVWFLDSFIQKSIKQEADSIICGLSPISGGYRLESAFNLRADILNITQKIDVNDLGINTNEYPGRCSYPQWDENGTMLHKGHFAVYATTTGNDEKEGYTFRWSSRSLKASEGDVAVEDNLYRNIHYKRDHDFGVRMIFNAFSLPEAERDARLSEILRNEFSDINSLYDMVPKRVTHEVAHLLEKIIGLDITPEIETEVRQKISLRHPGLSHYAPPREAIAELAGISLLQQVKRNAALDFGIPTTMLDKVLEVSAATIDEKVSLASANIKREP